VKKIISILVLSLFFVSNVFGMPAGQRHWPRKYQRERLGFPDGLLFCGEYSKGIDASFSQGSPTATVAASRDATHPATYFDSSGVMQLTTTANVPRYNSGYYDTTGFHAFSKSGVMVEGATTNFLFNTCMITDFDYGFENHGTTPRRWGIENHSTSTSVIEAASKMTGTYGVTCDIDDAGAGLNETLLDRYMYAGIEHCMMDGYVYIQDATALGRTVNLFNMQNVGDFGQLGGVQLRDDGGQLKIGGFYKNGADVLQDDLNEQNVATGTWYHIKCELYQHATNGYFKFWFAEGAAALSLKTDFSGDTAATLNVDRIYFGAGYAQDPDDFTLYFDLVDATYSGWNGEVADEWASYFGVGTLATTSLMNISGARSQQVTHTFTGDEDDYTFGLEQYTANDTFDASGGNITITLSFWAKGDISGITSGTGTTYFVKVDGVQNNETWEETSIDVKLNDATVANLSSTEWRKFTYTGTLTDVAIDKCRVVFISLTNANKPAAAEDFDITITGVQIEKLPFASSFIPTTTAALTRNGESLKGKILGNRSASVESIVIKFAPAFDSTEIQNHSDIILMSSDTKTREMLIPSSWGDSTIVFYANLTDSNASFAQNWGTTWVNDEELTYGIACQQTSPYIELYADGVSVNTETADNFTTPAWGTYFWIGTENNGTDSHFYGTIFEVAFFDRVLSAEEMHFMHVTDWSELSPEGRYYGE